MADVTAKLAEALRRELQRRKVHSLPAKLRLMKALGLDDITLTEQWMIESARAFEDAAAEFIAAYEQAQVEPVAGLPKAEIIRAAVAAMPHTNAAVADDLMAGHTMHTEADDVVAIFCAGLRFADKEQAKPLKGRADFIAGYDAGLIDGRACERRDHARGEIRADFEARMKADGLSVARLDCGLYFSPRVGNEWEAEKRKFAASVAQAEPRKPLTDAQFERLYNNMPPSIQQDARSRLAFIRIGRAVEAAHGIKEQP